MSVLLKNAFVVDLESPYHHKKVNLLLKDGIIVSFSATTADQTIDLGGKIVTPGWFDLNASFCDPGFEFKEDINSGTKAALHGGFTDMHLLPITEPVIENKSHVEYLQSCAKPEVDIHISASLSCKQAGGNLTEILDLHHYGAISFSDGDLPIWNTELLLKALQYTTRIGTPLFQNARDLHLSANTHMHEGIISTMLGLRGEPSVSEKLIINRDLDILRYGGGHIHFTKVTTADGIELVKKAKEEGLMVTCDVSVHHLLFSDEQVKDFDVNYKSLPPYRSERDRKALIEGIMDGTVDAICSNHRPQDTESKQLEFDLAEPGSIALQSFYPSLLQTGIPFEVLAEKVTNGPRKVLRQEPVVIKERGKAKITILDPDRVWKLDAPTNQSKSINSPFWEHELKGMAIATVNNLTLNVFENVEV